MEHVSISHLKQSKAKLSFEEELPDLIELALPQSLMEVLARGQGFCLLSGTKKDRLIQSEHQILRELSENTELKISSFGELPFAEFPYAKKIQVETNKNNLLQTQSEVILFGAIVSAGDFELCLELAEEGRLVVGRIYALSLLGGLHKVNSMLRSLLNTVSAEGSVESWHYRLSEVLEIVFHQTLVFGTQGDCQLAYEMALITTEVRNHLRHGNISAIEDLLNDSKEKMGLVSRNQSLVQLLVRRKIDLKAAFAKTKDPAGLDLLLRHLGF